MLQYITLKKKKTMYIFLKIENLWFKTSDKFWKYEGNIINKISKSSCCKLTDKLSILSKKRKCYQSENPIIMIHSISKMEQTSSFFLFLFLLTFNFPKRKDWKTSLLFSCCIFDAKWKTFTLYNNALLCSFYCLVMKSFYSKSFVHINFRKLHSRKISYTKD